MFGERGVRERLCRGVGGGGDASRWGRGRDLLTFFDRVFAANRFLPRVLDLGLYRTG